MTLYNALPAYTPVRAYLPQQANAGSRLRKSHRIAGNFTAALGAGSHAVVPVSLTRLIAMLSQEHEPGAQYVVVCKRTNVGGEPTAYATTVLDVPLGRLYRATHPSGLAPLWRAIAAQSGGAVKHLKPQEAYVPPPAPERQPREYWYVRNHGADA